MSKKKNISILCGGPSSEYEVSLNTAKTFLKHIDKEKYTPYIFYISKDSKALLFQPKSFESIDIPESGNLHPLFDEILKLKDMHTNIIGLHGEFGEDGTLQSILEFLEIPFTGCDSISSALCMDKYRSSLVVDNVLGGKNFIIPNTQIYKLGDLISTYKFSEKVCIKPNARGSSVGIHIIKSKEELKTGLIQIKNDFSLDTDFIVQPLIDYDIELSCGCLEKENGEFIKLPAIEILPQSSDFFDYKAKYTKGGSIEITPPEHISKEIADQISQLAIDIHKLLGCSLYSRSDFLIKNNTIYYLETNTLPGMTSTSLLPQEANAVGINFTQLIDFLIENS